VQRLFQVERQGPNDRAEVMETLRTKIPREELDYQVLLDALDGYARPRDKITDLLRKGVIVRVKKGLYVLGPAYSRRPYSKELLANLVYGPSCISLESALELYGLIPERVEAVTSVTTGRSRSFHTPVGLFVYRRIPLAAYRWGVTRKEAGDGVAYLVATPERALADKIRMDRGTGLRSMEQMQAYLAENLRVDLSALAGMEPEAIAEIGERYGSNKVRMLAGLVRRLRQKAGGHE
jgi:phage terminase large subunit-like protein